MFGRDKKGGPVGMSHAREATLFFFVIYLSPLMYEVYLLVNLF